MGVEVNFPQQAPESRRGVDLHLEGDKLVARRISRSHTDPLEEAFVVDTDSLKSVHDFFAWVSQFVECKLPSDVEKARPSDLKSPKPVRSMRRPKQDPGI